MAQITGVGFSNFRVFEKSTFFDLAPITVFTGTNSSGKSSVFKGLLLFQNNRENLLNLSFAGEDHKLGTFENSKNKSLVEPNLEFEFRFDRQLASGREVDTLFLGKYILTAEYKQSLLNFEGGVLNRYQIVLDDNGSSEKSYEDVLVDIEFIKDNYVFYFNLPYFFKKLKEEIMPIIEEEKDEINIHDSFEGNISFTGGKGKIVDYLPWITNLLPLVQVDYSPVSTEKLKEAIKGNSVSLTNNQLSNLVEQLNEVLFSKFSLFYKPLNFGLPYSDDTIVVSTFFDILKEYEKLISLRTFFYENVKAWELLALAGEKLDDIHKPLLEGVSLGQIINDQFILVCNKLIIPEIENLIFDFNKATKNIRYIEGVRANSQRLYTNQSQGTYFNQLLFEIGQKWASISADNLKFAAEISFVQKWIKIFGIADEIKIERVKGIATEVYFIKGQKKIDLIDLGYGVTQYLPILLHITHRFKFKTDIYDDNISEIYSNNGALLLIEEPESNLHPKLQSLLADFFIDVAKNFEVTLLIETHSEYLIRRLQVLTASGEAKPEDSVIYYLNGDRKSEDEKQVTKININTDGSLTDDFGPGFLDEATNWKLELMRLKNAKLHEVNLN